MVFPGRLEIRPENQEGVTHHKEINLFSAGMDVPNHAPFIFRRHFHVTSVRGSKWIEELNRVIDANSIQYIYPANDDVIVALARNADQILARLVLPPAFTCELTRSKSATYR